MLFTLVLSVDSFSGALALGFRPFTKNRVFIFALMSGGLEGLGTFVGFLLGNRLIDKIAAYDHWVAFSITFIVGARMIYASLTASNSAINRSSEHSLWKIALISAVTSIDSVGIGLALGVANKPIGNFIVSISLGAFFATLLGLGLAKRLSQRFGNRIETFGGLVLVILSFEMLKI